jgi:uncharacterized membrane protein (UPF0127 family)
VNFIRVVNRSRGTLLGNRIMLVDTWSGRLRGFLGRPEPQPGEGMLLVRCNAVHMYGLDFPLDLVFLDDKGDVVGTIEELKPWKRSKRFTGARFALELPKGVVAASKTDVGDRLSWTSPEPVFTPSPRVEELSRVQPGLWFHSTDDPRH